MSRILIALLAVAGFAAQVSAQPGNLPLSPGVRPGSSIGPGTQFLPPPAPRFVPHNRGTVGTTPNSNAGFSRATTGYSPYRGYGQGDYYYGFYPGIPSPYDQGYRIGGASPTTYGYGSPIIPVEVEFVPIPLERNIVLANEFPATLSMQFPAAADVWLNGKPVKGEANEDRVLVSPVLKPGEKFTFDVRATWEQGGKVYKSTHTVTLGSGDRSRLLVVTGTEVK